MKTSDLITKKECNNIVFKFLITGNRYILHDFSKLPNHTINTNEKGSFEI